MKIKKILFNSLSISLLPIVFLSSCSTVSENSPVKLDKSVFEAGNKTAFNEIFNLLDNQVDSNSFIEKTSDDINKMIADEISKDKLIQEKLRIYFFVSIYNSLNDVYDIIDGNIVKIEVKGEREKGIEEFKKIINDSIVKPESNNSNWKKYDSLEAELNKITDMKITLSYKLAGKFQYQWTWETSFKLADDSELKKLLKIQNNSSNSIFYRRYISNDEKEEIYQSSMIGGSLNQEKYENNLKQAMYQSSKWYWDEKEGVIKSIKKGSNLNPYSTNGTIGGFTNDDSKRTEFAIDFEQHSSNIKLYKPVFLFQSNNSIETTYINSEWDNFLKYKRYRDSDSTDKDPKKAKDIRIDLKSAYIEYDKKI